MGNEQNKTESLVPKPNWMEDSAIEFCYSCRSVFSPVSRRHHCRRCMNLYCRKCSNLRDKIMVYNLHGKHNRICKGCIVLVRSENCFLEKFYPTLKIGLKFEAQFSLIQSSSPLGSKMVPRILKKKAAGHVFFSIDWTYENQNIRIIQDTSPNSLQGDNQTRSSNIPVINFIRVTANGETEKENFDDIYISLLFDHAIEDDEYNSITLWNNGHSSKEMRFLFDALKALLACKKSRSHGENTERERNLFLKNLEASNMKQKRKN